MGKNVGIRNGKLLSLPGMGLFPLLWRGQPWGED